jgi:hypothetical protein
MSTTNHSWQVLERIKLRRVNEPEFMRPSRPAEVDDFAPLKSIGFGFDLASTLGDMKDQGLLSYETTGNQQIERIALTVDGEKRLEEYIGSSYLQSHHS